MIETIPLSPGVTLRCFRDTRFKQGAFSIQLVRPMGWEEASANALLPSVLLRGTQGYPDLRAVTRHLDDLYGATLTPMVRRIGDLQTTGLYCGFMDDRFALPGDRVLARIVDFTREVLLESPLQGGGFLPEFVEGEKQNLISAIESERNDKRAYAMARLFERMCRGDSFGIPRLGTVELVAAITPLSLRAHYETLLRESPVEIFYTGSAPSDEIAGLFREIFASLPGSRLPLPPQLPLTPAAPGEETEILDVNQGNLCLGFVSPFTGLTEEFPAMQLLNLLYGGGMTSKLFLNVREKQSLCYSVGSAYHSSKGILTVYAGIDPATREETQAQILRQLALCREGQISDEEITAAREAMVSSLQTTHDSPGAIESYYLSSVLCGRSWTPEQHIARISRVTKDDLVRAARSLELHTTYFLRGDSE